jgi:predicted metal-binding membrane protein
MFLGMWIVMMVAMMLPSLAPMLWRYRLAVGNAGVTHPAQEKSRLVSGVSNEPRPLSTRELGWLTTLVGFGYFFVWTVLGMAIFPLGVAVAAMEMQLPTLARTVPIAVGVVVLIAGVLQFTAWKARQLACCRETVRTPRALPANARTAWRHGLRIGLHCGYCCANLTMILLVIGVMDLRAMALVTVAITAERLAPAGERVARVIGAVIIGTGLLLIARAAGAL